MNVLIKKLRPDAVIPTKAYAGDAGWDLFSLEQYWLYPGERYIFNLGFALEFPSSHVFVIHDKSSHPLKGGIHTMGGVFDSGFRGEYNVMLINLGEQSYHIKVGQKIAQGLFLPVPEVNFVEVAELSESERGVKGFGSSFKLTTQEKV